MSTLYVSEQGARIHKKGKRLLVYKGKKLIDDIPLIKLDKLVLLGKGVSITTPAMFSLSQQGVDLAYMTQKGGFAFRLIGKEHNNSRLRFQQALFVSSVDASLRLARNIVSGKIHNQRTLVRRHSHKVVRREMHLEVMGHSLKQVEDAQNLDKLRGIEGMAAKNYFGLYKHLVKPPRIGSWGFYGRNYYPPRDPINALLSFGYTMLLNEVSSACQNIGLDPFLGCFHAINYGRPSLSLDIMEEFRPIIVGSLVLNLVNHGRIQPGDFQVQRKENPRGAQRDGVFMSEAARKIFLAAFEKRINHIVLSNNGEKHLSYRQIIQMQTQQVAQIILDKRETYQPYIWR